MVKNYWELKYEFRCQKHGMVKAFVSGYPPKERLDCPVTGCNYRHYLNPQKLHILTSEAKLKC